MVPGSMPSNATVGVPGGADGAAGEAVRRRRAERGGAEDRRPQLAHARESLAGDIDAEMRRHADGRAPRRGAVRALRPRGGRGVLRRDHRAHDRDVPARGAGEDPRRRVPLGGLRRARRRRPAAPARAADDAHQGAATGWSSTSPAPTRRRRGRSTTPATTPTATSSRSGSRRSCATSPTRPSGWPSSTSTRASSS